MEDTSLMNIEENEQEFTLEMKLAQKEHICPA